MRAIQRIAQGVAFAAVLTTCSQASATVLVATFTGTFASGFDLTGLFGTSNANLAGKAYVARYVFDASKGVRNENLPTVDEIYGGSRYGYSSPVSASISVDGHTQSVAGTYYGDAQINPSYFNDLFYGAEDYSSNIILSSLRRLNNGVFSTPAASLLSPLSTIPDFNDGELTFTTYNFDTSSYLIHTYADMHGVGTLTITEEVPEPASWILMITGFGAMGAMLRRRRASLETA